MEFTKENYEGFPKKYSAKAIRWVPLKKGEVSVAHTIIFHHAALFCA